MVEGEGSKEEEIVKTKIDVPCDNRKHHKKRVFHLYSILLLLLASWSLQAPAQQPRMRREEVARASREMVTGHR